MFVYVTRKNNSRYPLSLQAVDKLIIIDSNINAFADMHALGLYGNNGHSVEIIRLITQNTVD